jgi:hypothetical protein
MSDTITNEQARERELQLRDEHEADWHDHALSLEHEAESDEHAWFIKQEIAELSDDDIEKRNA